MSDHPETRPVTPFALAMVLCDFIYRDPYTGKHTLFGTFSTITGSSFPVVQPHMCIYAALSGGRGVMPLRLEVTRADDDEIVKVLDADRNFMNDPRSIHELVFGLAGLTFPSAGEYRFSLYANHEFIVERRILVFNPSEDRHDN